MTSPNTVYSRVAMGAAAVFVSLLAVPSAFQVTPDRSGLEIRAIEWRLPELCLIKRTTGIECRTCGLGRSVVMAGQLQFDESRAAHPGGVIFWGWLVVSAAWRVSMALASLVRNMAPIWPFDLAGSCLSLFAICIAILAVSIV